jgi:hypothetical protein
MRRATWVVVALLALGVAGCAGKRVATTFGGMAARVPAGTTVHVTTVDGSETTGRLAAVSGTSMQVVLRDASRHDFREADVARVRVRDPLWNGMLIGAAAGGLSTFIMNDESCSAPNPSPDCRRVSRGAGVAIGALLGAGLGAGFDALNQQLVFHGPAGANGASLWIAPVLAPRHAGIVVRARF